MKKLSLLLLALAVTVGTAAQNPTAYFMEGTTFRSQFNPAFAPLRGYVNIPVLGGIQISTAGNLSLDKVLFPRNGRLVTLLDGSISAADALGGLKTNNLLGIDTRVNIIGFGAFARNHKDFWSFDLNMRVNEDTNLPYTLFEFLKTGSSVNVTDVNINANTYLEAAFSYSFPLLDDRLYVGVRGKFLAGMARTRMYYDRFNVTMGEDKWIVDARGGLDISAAGQEVSTSIDEQGNPTYELSDIDFFNKVAPAGYGFALDLGATYDILPNLQASLAVTDLGAIWWGKKHTTSGVSSDHLTFEGVEIVDGETSPQPKFDLNVLKFQPQEAQSAAQMLRTTINAGVEYGLWRHKIGLGLLYTARIWQHHTLHNITGSVNFHPVRWFTLTGSYSVIGNRGGAVGLALNLCPNWINFFIGTDLVMMKHAPKYFIPVKRSAMNLTFGLGVPIGKRSHRIAAYVREGDKR